MSDQTFTAKILSVIQKVEIKKLIGGLSTQVRDKPSVVQKGKREIQRLETNRPSVATQENFVIRRVLGEQTILKVSNIGPQGGRGEDGEQGPQGEPGSIDNFEMEDLSAIFRGRLR